MTTSTPRLWAVIPAGGAGTRLWPLSRRSRPKFLLDLSGSGRSLLQQTVDRLQVLTDDRIMVVTGVDHRAAVCDQVPQLPAERVIAEPSGRDSMPAIGLAAAMLERIDPDAVMGSFAADHVIEDRDGFVVVVGRAAELAQEGWLVTIGIRPTAPVTGFGYIRPGRALPGEPVAQAAAEFVEKPTAEVAEHYVEQGYWWNAGMFVARPGVLLDLLAEHDPDFAARLRALAAEPDRLAELWPQLPKVAIDHAVAEPAAAAGRVAVVPADVGWTDLGDFAALADQLTEQPAPPDAWPSTGQDSSEVSRESTIVLGDPALVDSAGSTGLVVPGAGRFVAVIGLDDVVVVDTPDGLLVTTTAHAQDVKQVVARLEQSGRLDLL